MHFGCVVYKRGRGGVAALSTATNSKNSAESSTVGHGRPAGTNPGRGPVLWSRILNRSLSLSVIDNNLWSQHLQLEMEGVRSGYIQILHFHNKRKKRLLLTKICIQGWKGFVLMRQTKRVLLETSNTSKSMSGTSPSFRKNRSPEMEDRFKLF